MLAIREICDGRFVIEDSFGNTYWHVGCGCYVMTREEGLESIEEHLRRDNLYDRKLF